MFKKLIFVVACLITLVGLFYGVENWRGKHAWETYRQAREAQGDSFEWSAITPKPVPDAENFAAIPLFTELFPKPASNAVLTHINWQDCPQASGNWNEGRTENLAAWQACLSNDNVLTALAKYDPIVNEITAASHRPKSRFPIRYEDHINALLPHLGVMRNLARIYRLRALAELAAGNTEAALTDIQVCLRMAAAIDDEPVLISFLVRNALLNLAIQPVWEGLAAHRWTAAQLTTLQTQFEQVDQFDAFANAMRGERLFAVSAARWLLEDTGRLSALAGESGDSGAKWLVRCVPRGWVYQNMLRIDQFYTETYLPSIDFEHRVITPAAFKKLENLERFTATSPYNILCRMLLPAVGSIGKKAAQSQTAIDEVTIACALERYRLAQGELPENLTALVPQCLKRLPADVITGEMLHYRRTAPDQFMLYSVGWNTTDDGGKIAFTPGRHPHQDYDQGDWVWFCQPTASEKK